MLTLKLFLAKRRYHRSVREKTLWAMGFGLDPESAEKHAVQLLSRTSIDRMRALAEGAAAG